MERWRDTHFSPLWGVIVVVSIRTANTKHSQILYTTCICVSQHRDPITDTNKLDTFSHYNLCPFNTFKCINNGRVSLSSLFAFPITACLLRVSVTSLSLASLCWRGSSLQDHRKAFSVFGSHLDTRNETLAANTHARSPICGIKFCKTFLVLSLFTGIFLTSVLSTEQP